MTHCVVLVYLNIKTSLSFLIHTFLAAQAGKIEGRIPTVFEAGAGDASCALNHCIFLQERFPCHELDYSSSSSNTLNNMAVGHCCCCYYTTTNRYLLYSGMVQGEQCKTTTVLSLSMLK